VACEDTGFAVVTERRGSGDIAQMIARSYVTLALAAIALASSAKAGTALSDRRSGAPAFGHYEAVLSPWDLKENGVAEGALPALEFNYGGFPNTSCT